MAQVQTTHRKPNKGFSAITQLGLKAFNLYTAHAARLEKRVPKAKADELAADLGRLGVHVPGAITAQGASKAATLGQHEALANGWALVSAIRFAIGQQAASDDVKAGWGIGQKVNAKVVSHVVAAITLMLNRAEKHPNEPAALNILPADLEKLANALAAIKAADAKQEKERAAAPQSTKLRNQTAHRIVATTKLIAGAGVTEFALEAERAEFQALVGAGNPGRRGNGGGNGGEEGGADGGAGDGKGNG